MEINYKDIVPWGRSFDEYIKIFSLTPDDLNPKILDCGGGPSSFNAEMTKRGKKVISIDPIYNLSADDIEIRINETYDDVINQTRANVDKFIWQNISSVEELGRIRMAAMKQFLDDYVERLSGSGTLNGSVHRCPHIQVLGSVDRVP